MLKSQRNANLVDEKVNVRPRSSENATKCVVLGIETSCDETAAAIVSRDASGRGKILANVVRSQFDLHKIYGGVVPEIAARAHTECIDGIIRAAMTEAGLSFCDLDGIAADLEFAARCTSLTARTSLPR